MTTNKTELYGTRYPVKMFTQLLLWDYQFATYPPQYENQLLCSRHTCLHLRLLITISRDQATINIHVGSNRYEAHNPCSAFMLIKPKQINMIKNCLSGQQPMFKLLQSPRQSLRRPTSCQYVYTWEREPQEEAMWCH